MAGMKSGQAADAGGDIACKERNVILHLVRKTSRIDDNVLVGAGSLLKLRAVVRIRLEGEDLPTRLSKGLQRAAEMRSDVDHDAGLPLLVLKRPEHNVDLVGAG